MKNPVLLGLLFAVLLSLSGCIAPPQRICQDASFEPCHDARPCIGAAPGLHSGCDKDDKPRIIKPMGAFPADLKKDAIELQILAFNDLHGQIKPPLDGRDATVYFNSAGDPVRVEAGGLAYLAKHINKLKAANLNTVVVSAGDCIGASSFVSAYYHDEPTVEALGGIGLEYSAVGNHEFDEGVPELLRIQYGGCHPQDGCQDGDRFFGADYQYLSANVVYNASGRTLFPPYRVKYFSAVPVAFIGISLKETRTAVDPSKVEGITFRDEAGCINEVVMELKRRNIKAIVVLIHNGGNQSDGGLPDEGRNFSGAIEDIVNRSDDEVDLFITGHTHKTFITQIDGRAVTQAGWKGMFLTDIDLLISKQTKDVVAVRAENIAVTPDVPEERHVSLITGKYVRLSAPLAERVVGSITGNFTKGFINSSKSDETSLGNLIADAFLEAARPCGAVAAFMNIGGIRADLMRRETGGKGPYQVTYEDAFNVQPFGNRIIIKNLTGQQIDDLLEEQFDNPMKGRRRMLQVSSGFNYTWNNRTSSGQRIDINSIEIEGSAIDANKTYRIAVNEFLATGGDNFTVFRGKDESLCVKADDLQALTEYMEKFSPLSPGNASRIIVMD